VAELEFWDAGKSVCLKKWTFSVNPKYDYERDTRVSVQIGVPVNNMQIYILDKNLNPVVPNTVGELYISGDGVARGYLNRLELTQEKFIANPFIAGRKMYKSGDLARFNHEGEIEYVGIADQQVKIRGYRIEPGEIEKYLLKHEAIKDAFVIALEDKKNGKYLCSYIVKRSEVSTHELKEFLLRYLPEYMIPVYFIELSEIPLTLNGKIKKELLPEPEVGVIGNTEFIAQDNENEKELINVVCDVLNVKRVSPTQNFYHLGGDSIKAIQISSKLNDKGLRIRVKDILSNPVIEEMALFLKQRKGFAANQEPCEGNVGLTPIVSWFFAQNFVNPNRYNQSVLLELKQEVETQKLDMILNELVKHHDSLRLNYNSQTGMLFYNNEYLDRHYNIEVYDLTEHSYSMQIDRMTFITDVLNSNFNIENDILIKACIFDLGRNGKRLLIIAHHLVIDGVSWRIVLEDMNTMLKQINNGQKIMLSSKTHSYQEWAETLKNYNAKEAYEEKNYWKQVLSKEFSFHTDYDLGEDTVNSRNTITIQLNEDLTECLLTKANTSYNTEPKDLLVYSLIKTIKEFTGNEYVMIEIEGHGREDIFDSIDISRTVGWFTSIYPFYIKLTTDNISDQIKEVKEELRRVPNKGIGFGILKYIFKAFNDNDKDKKYVRLNYLGAFTARYDNYNMKLFNEFIDSGKENNLTCIIDINCLILSGNLNVALTYSRNKFFENTMRKFLYHYVDNLKVIISHCCGKESIEFTPSDFDMADLTSEELDSLFS